MKSMQKNQTGFTLIELVVVIVILGILAATALPKFLDLSTDARASVATATDGALRSTNSMLYGKAAAAGVSAKASGSVTVNGAAVATTYGYADDLTVLTSLMTLTPATDFTITGTTVNLAKAQTPANCGITYVKATSATAPPTYTLDVTKC